jgi:zinc protease
MKSGPRADELRLAKTAILAQYARSVERVGGFGGKSDMLARCMTFTGNPDCYKTYLKRIQAATPAMVRQAMLRLAERRRLYAAGRSVPGRPRALGDTLDRSKGRRRPAGKAAPAAHAEGDAVERPEGGAGRAPQRAGGQLVDDVDAGFASDSQSCPAWPA